MNIKVITACSRKYHMTPEANPDENLARGNVRDVGAATEMAYAEKPFREAEVDYREQMSHEAREALNFIASKEAEKALERYEATKDEEDPVVRVLREKALAGFEAVNGMGDKFIHHAAVDRQFGSIGRTPVREWVERINWGTKELAGELVDEILKSSGDNKEKLQQLRDLGIQFQKGLSFAFSEAPRVGMGYTGYVGVASDKAGRWAAVLADMMAERGLNESQLKWLAISGKDSDVAATIDKELGFFERTRISFPSTGTALDKDMEKYGWTWDKKQGKYIKL